MTPTAAPTNTPTPAATRYESPTALIQRLPTSTLTAASASPTPAATLDVTPTYITATPIVDLNAATLTPTPSPTRFQPTVALNPDLLITPIAPPAINPSSFSTIGAAVYQYDVGPGQIFQYENVQLGGGVALFAPNPNDPNSYARTNQEGILLYRAIGESGESPMTTSPFFAGFAVTSSDENKNRISEIDWSADGRRFSFRIDPPPGIDTGNAGLWFWQPENALSTDPTYQIIRDCAAPDDAPCGFVRSDDADLWKTKAVEWSPQIGSSRLLLTLHLPQEGRNALAMAEALRDPAYANQTPPFVRYDYGYWDVGGQAVIVSGRRPDGRVIIGVVDSGLTGEQIVFDASAAGLWMQDAVRRADGRFFALGRPAGSSSESPLALYDGQGRALSNPIGEAAPEAVGWYPDRSAVVVKAQGRQYAVRVDEGLAIDATELAEAPRFARDDLGFSLIPDGVVRGSDYAPGQQLRVLAFSLNIRHQPDTDSRILGELMEGDYVAVIAGPYEEGDYSWWKVQTARNIIGWIAVSIRGSLTVAPA